MRIIGLLMNVGALDVAMAKATADELSLGELRSRHGHKNIYSTPATSTKGNTRGVMQGHCLAECAAFCKKMSMRALAGATLYSKVRCSLVEFSVR